MTALGVAWDDVVSRECCLRGMQREITFASLIVMATEASSLEQGGNLLPKVNLSLHRSTTYENADNGRPYGYDDF